MRWLGFAVAVSVMACCVGAVFAADESLLGIDHIPLAVKDLEQAVKTYQRLGFVIKPGRFHANGIRNAQVKYANGAGIELITATEPNDELTRRYLSLLSAGEGPAFVGFHCSDLGPVVERLRAANLAYSSDDGILEVGAPELDWLFVFAGTNQSLTDRPEHFAHPNTADATLAVWIAVSDPERVTAFFRDLGARLERKQVNVPDSDTAMVATLAEGEVVILPKQRQLIPGRPIVGVVFHVRDLDATLRVLRAGGVRSIRQLQTAGHRSVFVPPQQTRGAWLEFRQ